MTESTRNRGWGVQRVVTIKQHPPDRSPREFERIRDAYELLKDPHRRIEQTLLAADPDAPFVSLLECHAKEVDDGK